MPLVICVGISFACGCIANGSPVNADTNGPAGCLYMVVAYFITAVYMFVGWLILLIHMLKVSEELSTRCSDCGLQTSDNLRVKAQKQAELIRKLEDELENLKNYVKSFA